MSKPAPGRWCTTNWSSYNATLRNRGPLLIWIDKDKTSRASRDGRLGRPAIFSDAFVQFCLSIKALFKLPLRQTVRIVANRLNLAGLDLLAPEIFTLCRRWKTLTVQSPDRCADGPLILLVESAVIKFVGDNK